MFIAGGDRLFGDLTLRDKKDLIAELNDSSKWKKLATYLIETFGFSRRALIDDIEREANAPNAVHSPAELFLMELRDGMCDVDALRDWLKECDLLYALYIIVGEDELKITEQPYPCEAAMKDEISIVCRATGLPPPEYQWYHGTDELSGKTAGVLTLFINNPKQQGRYRCRVRQYDRNGDILCEKYSNYASLRIKPTSVEITKHPASVKVKLRDSLVLSCEATGHPSPRYQWYKNDNPLDGENCNILQVEKFDRENKGDYYCIVSNVISEKRTNKIEVKVDYPRQKASAKIALIIANDDYAHDEKLLTPENDGALLANLLTSIDFQVICLRNLTLEEMKNAVDIFCRVLTPDSYGLFYYVGHGFLHFHNFHMMPVDLPEKFLMNDTFSQDQLLACVDKKKPVLFVCILDMCLKELPEELNPEIYKEIPETCRYECNDNLILAYATCSHNFSYEWDGANNGLYAAQLTKHIASDRPAYEVFMDVAHAVRESNKNRTKDQKPMITTVTAEPYRYLTDEVICESSGSPTRYNSHVADLAAFDPQPMKIKFPKCGVSCRITIQPLKPPYGNVIQLTTSGLEEWDVSFRISKENPVKLHPMGRNCSIYNPQRISNSSDRVFEILYKVSAIII